MTKKETLQKVCDEIKANLAPILEEFVEEKERMIALKKPAKLGEISSI